MAWGLNRISTRLWALTAFMSVVTLVVGVSSFYFATYFEMLGMKERMPPGIRAELEEIVARGEKGSDRYYEIYDRYTGDEIQTQDLGFIFMIAVVSTVVGSGLSFFISRRISGPITEVARAATRVSRGERAVRIEHAGAGEIGDLVSSFNKMASEIESYERERTVLTAGIAHELRTPLTILKGRLHGLSDGVIDPEAGEADRLLRQVDQLLRLVEDLRTLAHADAGELQLDLRRFDLGAVCQTVAADLRPQAASAKVELICEVEPLTVRADPLRVAQIVTNLVTNAIKHAPEASKVHIEVKSGERKAIVSVSDEGTGFVEADRLRMFVPFWRAGADKAAGRPGSGMGLALASKLAEAQGGRISAENRTDRSGARFSLLLPLA
ncbi:HAMP domain-containing sensor histidine kinase [Blastomonas sp. UPD001]|uniref:HAMP domain-containing sensor histidine kinase n=1 Tax=Blastomonas sp. UPD001 TaxID=2217673 RepID=UPI000E3431DC|nr:HAMP domain-containing sensor histidine kinase [Blastomonas sp. UPD001]